MTGTSGRAAAVAAAEGAVAALGATGIGGGIEPASSEELLHSEIHIAPIAATTRPSRRGAVLPTLVPIQMPLYSKDERRRTPFWGRCSTDAFRHHHSVGQTSSALVELAQEQPMELPQFRHL